MSRIILLPLMLLLFAGQMFAASFSDNLLITSAGQSNDLKIARQIFIRAGLADPPTDSQITADSLSGIETLVVVVGGSSKGLGGAKDAANLELARVDLLLEKAKELHLNILCMHLGREGRRGVLSDVFITPVAENCSQIIVLEGGNEDEMFNTINAEKNIPVIEAVDFVDVIEHITQLFGLKKPQK
jgi:hypothetical protein